ncbi:MAG: amidohydrolase family protein, partial [Alphaproteobacteria bacterium]|nr:amidohydrolase family protein [Alphaproteobacteria bacterium]
RLIGYKPYWNFVRDKEANDIRIFDMLPAPLLELADERRWIITLHISRAGRLADPVNQRDMVEACRRYPNITFIYAHIGRCIRKISGKLVERICLPSHNSPLC